MKLFRVLMLCAGTLALGCGGEDTQAFIQKWNADFVQQKQACQSGQQMACQIACQMAISQQVCLTVGANATTPDQQAWVAGCKRDVTEQGRAPCAAAGIVNPNDTTPPSAPPMAPPPSAPPMAPPPSAPPETPPPAESPPTGDIGATGETVVHGALPKPVIQRIVRNHHPQIKRCYERGLAQNPKLEGKVTVKFIISGTGNVQMAAIAASTLGDPGVENCVSQVVRRINFPAPQGGGIVIVTYPFSFSQ